ncbi:MAG: hypothetical protein ACK5II_12615 [Paracoccus sp. (in: a-proteobacteria)]
MTSFSDSEKRLIAALGRIDQALDRRPSQITAIQQGNDGSDEIISLLQTENEALKSRQTEMEQEITRLSEVNESLATASRKAEGGKKAESALQKELDALKATRKAEIAVLDEIMTGLEALVAKAPRVSDAPYVEDVMPVSGEVVSFDSDEG